MKKKNNKNKKIGLERKVFDTTVKYLCPMIPLGKLPYVSNAETVECTMHSTGKYDVVLESPGYKKSVFFDTYFAYLLEIGYIKVVSNS